MAFSCGPEAEVSVAWVEAGKAFGLGSRVDGGICIRNEAAAVRTAQWHRARIAERLALILKQVLGLEFELKREHVKLRI